MIDFTAGVMVGMASPATACRSWPPASSRQRRRLAPPPPSFAGPVALEVVAPTLVRKTDIGAVRLGLEARVVVEEARAMGVVQDPTFGPVIACGVGGVTAELLEDVAVGVAPLTDRDARDMVRSLRTFPLLDGFRGAAKCDVSAVEDALLRH